MNKLHAFAACLIVSSALSQCASDVAAQSFPPLARQPVLDAPLSDAGSGASYVKGGRIKFAPGQPTGPHRHPSPVVGVVTAGSFVFAVEGGETRTLRAGDAFHEPAGVTIQRFDNASASEPAEIVAFYLLKQPDGPLIEMLDGR